MYIAKIIIKNKLFNPCAVLKIKITFAANKPRSVRKFKIF